MIKGIFFDLDGILADSVWIHREAFFRAMKHYGYDFTIEEYDNMHKRYHTSAQKLSYIDPQIKINEFQKIKDLYAFGLVDKFLSPNEDIVEYFRRLNKNGISISVVTNSSHEFATKVLNKIELMEYLDHLTSKNMVSKRKPDPEPYITAIGLSKLHPSEILVVEDQVEGIKSAEDAGIPIKNIIYSTYSMMPFTLRKIVNEFDNANVWIR